MPGARVESDESVAFRTVEREDAPFLQRAFANPTLRHPLGRRPQNVSDVEAEIADSTERDDRDHFLVCLEDEDAPPGRPSGDEVSRVGVVLIRNVTQRPNLAFWIVPEHQGRGYGRTAATLAIDAVFAAYDVPSIGAGVYDFNEGSQALLESLGFTQEGRQRKFRFVDGAYRDNLKYGLLREEWRDQTS